MRALCGSIIAAGAMIGLGLTALGFGIRFQAPAWAENPETHRIYGATSMTLILVILIAALVIGMGIAFVGLAYHHERRHRERLHHESFSGTSPRMPA